MDIRNIAIIAHVDHGKTTLTDQMLDQTGMLDDDSQTMDTDDLEQERGITIYSKNTSLYYNDTKINIVDTPGHADFGSEVERVLGAIDSVLLVVDAQEGPMPQTKFVLKKSLDSGLKPIVVINKIDKDSARPDEVHDEILELFIELGADESQLDFPLIYTNAKDGIAKQDLSDQADDLSVLLDTIAQEVPPAPQDEQADFRMQPFNLAYDDHLGRMAIGRVEEGTIEQNQRVFIKKECGETRRGRIDKIFTFEGFDRKEIEQAQAGDIIMISGLPEVYIGETICEQEDQQALPAIEVDEPVISMEFQANNSPFSGQEGQYVTSRQIKERLERELEVNVGLEVEFNGDTFEVSGRGEMHLAILMENMRREGYEIEVSEPEVIFKEINGERCEPFEEVELEVPSKYSGTVIDKLSNRAGNMVHMETEGSQNIIQFEIPTRGLFGYRSEFVKDTHGEGILSRSFLEFRPDVGEIHQDNTGSMASMAEGKALAYSLDDLQDRGQLFIEPGTEVYKGMVIGNTADGQYLEVNPTTGKDLDNMRAAGSDEKIDLAPAVGIDLQKGMEIMKSDEFLEVTPEDVRLRKQDF
jgi:GTP-binding protein